MAELSFGDKDHRDGEHATFRADAQASPYTPTYMMPDGAQYGDYAFYASPTPASTVAQQNVAQGHRWEPPVMEYEAVSNSPFVSPELDDIPLPMSLAINVPKMDKHTRAGSVSSSLRAASLDVAYFPYSKNMQGDSMTPADPKFEPGLVTSAMYSSSLPSHFSEFGYVKLGTLSL